MEEQSSTVKAAKAVGMISLMFFLSRILGFVRENLSGRLFNRFDTDSFFAAFIIPDTMYYLLVGGALSAAFIPIFTEYLAKGEEEEGWKVASTFINITIILLAIFTVFGIVFAQWLAPLEAPNFQDAKLRLLIQLTRVMFPAVCFTALAGLMGGVLNSYQHFLGPAMGPVVYNIGIIIGAFFLGPIYGVQGMAAGVVVGAIGNFITQVTFVRKMGKARYRFGYIDLKNPGFQRMIMLMLPALLGLSATQANLWITNAMASSLPEGSITALRFANRMIQLPIGIFASAIAMAFFPMLSKMVAQNQMDSFKEMLSLSLRSIFFLMIPSAVGLIALNEPIIRILFEGQKFSAHDTQMTAYAMIFYSLAMFAHAAILMLPRAFYALKDTITPVIVGISSVLISIILNMVFLKFTKLGVGGFALSFSLMGLINMISLMLVLQKKIGGIKGKEIFTSFAKATLASVVMGVALVLIRLVIVKFAGKFGISSPMIQAALTVVIGMGVGAVTFIGAAWLLKMEELKMTADLLGRKFKKRKAVA